MPNLEQSLQGRDLGHLKIIASLWGVDFQAQDVRAGILQLVDLLSDAELIAEVIGSVPEESRQALFELSEKGGKMSWSLFTRRFGEVREMGPAQRDRIQPFLDSKANPAEVLWYRAFLGRAFFDTPQGPEEFAYIPEDFLAILPAESTLGTTEILGRPSTSAEKAFTIAASDRILDDACTLLAGLRMGLSIDTLEEFLTCAQLSPTPLTARYLQILLSAAGLMDPTGIPLPEATRSHLEVGRGEALAALVRVWLQSSDFNELKLLPGISAEGEWKNDPLDARQAILGFLSGVPGWLVEDNSPAYWSLGSFLEDIRQKYPDYQRPAGDYDSWYLMDSSSRKYLRGIEHWDDVDGALIRFILSGPLHWLGSLELGFAAAPTPGERFVLTSFRYSIWAKDLLSFKSPPGLELETATLIVQSNGKLEVPRLVPRSVRYQIARFCKWDGISHDCYLYRLTSDSLAKARKQGLKINQLLILLKRYSQSIPPNLVEALNRWDKQGSEARFEQVVCLRVKNPEMLAKIRQSKASRFFGELLGPTAVIVRAGAVDKVAAILAEMGYLSEVTLEE